MTLSQYFVLFMIYSCLGWLIECILVCFQSRKLINRGFLCGPYCPIYGWGCILIIILLKDSMNDLYGLFLKAIIICSLLEYFTSYFMEKIFKARWWDYSDKKFNINGRICLETMLPFGILACLVMYIINPFFVSMIESININVINIIAIILLIIFLSDNIISFKVIFNVRTTITKISKDNTEEITKLVKRIFSEKSFLYRRINKSFPKFQARILKIKKSDLKK